jgi:NitT/TauT family transport system substrate-binding protein
MKRCPASRRFVLAGAMLLPLLQALGGCSNERQGALRIGTNVWIGSEPLYLARDLGLLDAMRAQLVEYPSASEVLRAFRNQAIDGMVITLDELFTLAADGFDPRVVLVLDVSHGADAVVGRAGMKTMRDLAGKAVAVEGGALGAFMLSRALALEGMRAGDVKVVHLESNEQPAAFERGQVDGAVTYEPYRARLLLAGARTLFDSTRIPGEIVRPKYAEGVVSAIHISDTQAALLCSDPDVHQCARRPHRAHSLVCPATRAREDVFGFSWY